LEYVKGKISKNIYFSKQNKERPNRYGTINPASNYSYDYNLVKIKRSALADFGIIQGRDAS
jgi:hypothetical protein